MSVHFMQTIVSSTCIGIMSQQIDRVNKHNDSRECIVVCETQ